MGILGTIIGAGVYQGSGMINTAGGFILGGLLGSYLHSIKASCDREKFILQLEKMPESEAKFINAHFEPILLNALEQLDQIDEQFHLKLKLGSVLKEQMAPFCSLTKQENTDCYQVLKIGQGIDTLTRLAGNSSPIERLIDEYFFVYLNINRKEIHSKNRAMARSTVQIMRNSAYIFAQVLKIIAELPGQENEIRLQRCQEIMQNYFNNILNNDNLVRNYQKTPLEYLYHANTQREILAKNEQQQFTDFIDHLVLNQREIDIFQRSTFSLDNFYEMGSLLIELMARLFDKDAAREFTEINSYKIKEGMLRADTHSVLGKFGFDETGIFKILKPLAECWQNMHTLPGNTDALSYLRNQPIFSKEYSEEVSLLSSKKMLVDVDKDARKKIAGEILNFSQLFLITYALERNFLHDLKNHGNKGLKQRGEFYSKRALIAFFYKHAQQGLVHFFHNNAYVTQLLDLLNNVEWLKNNTLPRIGDTSSYLEKTEFPDAEMLVQRRTIVKNTLFNERISHFELFRKKQNYIQQAFLKDEELIAQEKDHVNLRDNSLYLFNISHLLDEFGLGGSLLNTVHDNKVAVEPFLNAVYVTHRHLQQLKALIMQLSGQFVLIETLTDYQIAYGEQRQSISAEMYHFLLAQKFAEISWHERPVNLFYLEKSRRSLTIEFPQRSNFSSVQKFYKNMQQLQTNMKKQFSAQNDSILNKFFNDLCDVNAHIFELIKNINFDDEKVKAIVLANKELRQKNKEQGSVIDKLQKQLLSAHSQLDSTADALNLLKENSNKNLQLIAETEAKNKQFYELVLTSLQQEVEEIKSFKMSLYKKLEEIRAQVKPLQSQFLDKEFASLQQEIEQRTSSFLKRWSHYEEQFAEANETINKNFKELKAQFSAERELIEQLEQQLNEAMQKIQRQQQDLAYIEKDVDRPHVIVHNLKNLLTYLEERFRPRLSFFSSYRPVKTQNLLVFIELLLANKRYLKENLQHFSPEQLEKELDNLLQDNKVVNATRFLQKSCSATLIRSILKLFLEDRLVPVLQNEGILYHDGAIHLVHGNQIVYKELNIPCSIQPS